MKRMLAALAGLTALAMPASAEGPRKTEMIDAAGQQVESLLLRYPYDATWRLNASNVLLRNTQREHVLVTFKEPCHELEIARAALFVPALIGRVRASLDYEVRDGVKGQPACDIRSVRMVKDRDEARALAGPED